MFAKNSRAHLKHLNRAVRCEIRNLLALHFPMLDLETLQLVGYSDASFASNYDLTSRLGYIVLLMDTKWKAILLTLKTYKARRFTRSVLGAEFTAFSDLFDVASSFFSRVTCSYTCSSTANFSSTSSPKALARLRSG